MQKTSPILTVCFWLTLVSGAAAQTGGSWQILAPMPTARQELATAALNGKIYAIGGYDSARRSTNIVEVYDPTTDTWASARPIPRPLNHNSAAVAAGKLYSFGGSSRRAFVYDEVSNSWSLVAPMRFLHNNTPAVGVFNNKIYVAGGTGSSNKKQRAVEVYDPVANIWRKLRPMRVGRNHCGGAFIDGKFYVVGGRRTVRAMRVNEVYDPQTNRWTRRPPLPTARAGIAVAAVNGELFVFGGETFDSAGSGDLHGEVEVFSPTTNSWRRLSSMPAARHGIWASVIGNQIFLPGGGSVAGFGATHGNQVFTVSSAASGP
jgi:N-acetylneuraminic acid mutarotase